MSSTWTWPSVTTESCTSILEPFGDPDDARRAAARLVDVDHRAAEADVALRHFELARRVHQKPVQRLVGTEADHRVVRAGHADVGLERRGVRQEAFVRGRPAGGAAAA